MDHLERDLLAGRGWREGALHVGVATQRHVPAVAGAGDVLRLRVLGRRGEGIGSALPEPPRRDAAVPVIDRRVNVQRSASESDG